MSNLIKYTHTRLVVSEGFITSIIEPPLGGSMRVVMTIGLESHRIG